ncbi:MAG: hypothetical protein MUE74_00035 [Bacteroidales bacterium]|nr:hypothetical protein [Bacteroidales bacterium]
MKTFNRCLFFFFLLPFSACNEEYRSVITINNYPSIFPDYKEVTIPYNIAPLNFRVKEEAERLIVKIKGKGPEHEFRFRGNKARFHQKDWEGIMKTSAGNDLEITVSVGHQDSLKVYKSFTIHVSEDKIDDYMVYRLIMPGFQNWNQMGIYLRELSSFSEETVINSRLLPGTCMNCHTFLHNDPQNMVLHLRESYGGTILYHNNVLEKLNTKAGKMFANAAFPAWHPSAKYIAFSVNRVNQVFHASGSFRAAAIDMKSDIFIYDIERNEMLTSPALSAGDNFETFPCFSADGTKLFYCSADSVQMPQKFQQARYSLCSVSFDPETGTIGSSPDTVLSAAVTGKSMSLPRVSPNGRFLMFVMADHGCFPSYNPEADLWMLDLENGNYEPLTILNSDNVESWHSWSSDGHWVVFSSRRENGLHSNPFIAYIDSNGKPHKPFLLPQEDPSFYDSFLFSYNIPELIKAPVKVRPYTIVKTARSSPAVQVSSGSGH